MSNKYQEVIDANIALHSKLSVHYNSCEPHFRVENVQKVEDRLVHAFKKTDGKRMLDLGCGTGFMINIGKKYFKEITGVDVTQAMLDKVDRSGNAKIELITSDTGSVKVAEDFYDVATANSFLHHLYDITPTLNTAFKSLKKGGVFYGDLEPNFYYWESIGKLERSGIYDPIVKREIEMTTFKDEDFERNFGVAKDIFNHAEYGKNIAGGFKEEDIREKFALAGFSNVEIYYEWFIGQANLINNENYTPEERFKYAEVMDKMLQRTLPLTRHLFKYIWIYAVK